MRTASTLALVFVAALVARVPARAQFFLPVLPDITACAYSISPTVQNVPAGGGTFTTNVTANCPYYVTPSDSWIMPSGPVYVTTATPLSYTVAASTSAVPRTGQINIGTAILNITQAGIGCVFTFSSQAGTLPAAGGDGTVTFSINNGCAYNVASDSPWLTFVSSSAGLTGRIQFFATANTNPLPRVANISAGGQNFVVTQFGTQCAPALSTTSLRAPAAGANLSLQIVAPTGCSYSVQNSASWITNVQNSNSAVTFTVQANTGTAARSTFLLVGGIQVTVTQPPPGTFINTMINAASLPPLTQTNPLAPGEMFIIQGSGLGPLTLTGPTLDPSGTFLINSLGGTQVLVNGNPAALIYASEPVVAAVMPFGVTPGSTATVAVSINGTVAAQTTVPITNVDPGIFTANATGSGQASALNSDFSINTPSTPAKRGSFLVLYATGLGALQTPLTDGSIDPGADATASPVIASIGNVSAPVTYAGAAPYIVAGVYQINVSIPLSVTPGPAVPVQMVIAGQGTTVVTVAIQ